ncbi:MAG: DUF4835 family protein [Bacteroidetes bacterium]|nr:DUF4835 family protein [Bacteroidota bacterium]
MFKKIVAFIFLGSLVLTASAQELNCSVTVMTPTIQASDKSIYETLQTSIREFLNNRKWTQDQFLNQERIDCSIQINIKNRISTDEFDATIQITSGRPVYKTSYKTPVMNILDKDFTFKYVQDQVLEFDESAINSNLTAVIAFYANLVVGFDYESFSPDGGSACFAKAQTIVNAAQSIPDKGWKAFESSQNRYWLIENLLNVSFRPFRSSFYKYHRLGFDIMEEKISDGRSAVLESIKELKKVYQDKPGSYLMQTFFDVKADEVVNLFSAATPDEKSQVVQVLNLIDPAHSNKYNAITGGQ